MRYAVLRHAHFLLRALRDLPARAGLSGGSGLVLRRGLAGVVAALVALAMLPLGAAAAVRAADEPTAPTDRYHPAQASKALTAQEKSKLVAASTARGKPDLARKELVGERSQRSKTFLDPVKGLNVTQVSTQSINYRDEKGAWQPIDNKLTAVGTDGVGGWKNGANAYAASLPKDLTKPVKVTDTRDTSAWISLQVAPAKTPVDTLPKVPNTNSAAAVPAVASTAGKIEAKSTSEVTYADPLPGVDVSYAATGDAVKETITLDSLAAVDALPGASLTYTLRTPAGLDVVKAEDGGLAVKNAKGEVVFVVPAAFMDDAAGQHSNDVITTLSPDKALTTAQEQAWTLTLTPDRAWLADPARSWPVVVDPTIGPPSAMKACTIRSDTPTVNDCANSELLTSWHTSTGYERRALIQFDTLLDVIPANAQMAVAYLNLHANNVAGAPASKIDVRGVGSSTAGVSSIWTTGATWNKRDVTNNWNTAGGNRTTPYERKLITPNGSYQQLQITRLVQAWTEGGLKHNGLILQKTSQDVSDILRFGSPSSANPPNLYVEWDPRTGVRKSNTAAVTQNLTDRVTVTVNPATGNAAVTTREFTIKGAGLDLNSAFTSQSLDTGQVTSTGYGMTPSLGGSRLSFYNGGTAANAETMFYTDGVGAQWTFLRNSEIDGTWIRPKGLDMDLAGIGGGTAYTLTDRKSQTVTKYKNIGTSTTNVFGIDTITDKNGNKITFNYDASVRSSIDNTLILRTVTDTRGRTFTITNTSGYYTDYMTDSTGRVASYAGSNDQLDTLTDTMGGHTDYEYDGAHRVTAVVAPEDWGSGVRQRLEMTYDSEGRVKTLKRVSTALGNPTWQFTYNAFTRDGDGKPSTITQITDPLGHVSEYTADGRGVTTKIKNALGKDKTTKVNDNDDVTESTNATGAGTASAESVKNTYSTGDTYQLTKNELPSGANTTYTYGTGANLYNLTESKEQIGGGTTPTYNTTGYQNTAAGNRKQTDRANGTITRNLYEGETDPAYGDVVHCGPSGGAAKSGSLCEVRDGAYTAGASRAAASAHRTAYVYDAQGQLATLKPPGGGTLTNQTFTFDALSRLKTVTDGNGDVTEHFYDDLDRKIATDFDDGSGQLYDFGGGGGYTAISDGWLKNIIDYNTVGTTIRTTAYTRDAMGRITAVNRPEGNVGMGWDKASNLTSYTDNGGTVSYGYNNADQLTSLTMPGGNCSGITYASPGSASSRCVTFQNDDDGRRTGVKYPGGSTNQTTTLDKSGRPSQIVGKTATSTVQFDTTYGYTAAGADTNVLTRAVDNKNDRTTVYTYDGDQQLLTANTTVTSTSAQSAYERFCYDSAGNRTKYFRATPVANCTGTGQAASTFNGANEMTAATGVTPTNVALAGTTLSYDANGNETAAKSTIGRSTSYGDRGQATSFTPAGGSAANQNYIGGGNLERITSGSTTLLPSPLSPAPAWSATSGSTTWTVRDPAGQLIAIRIGSTGSPGSASEYYPFTDNLGNVRAMTTATGTSPSVSYVYSAFGHTNSTTGSLVQPYRYGQGYTDTATGLIKLGVRYYDPVHGRFTQQDPAQKEKQPYAYARNCATNLGDPTGAVSEKFYRVYARVAFYGAEAITCAAVGAGASVLTTPLGGLAASTLCGVGFDLIQDDYIESETARAKRIGLID